MQIQMQAVSVFVCGSLPREETLEMNNQDLWQAKDGHGFG